MTANNGLYRSIFERDACGIGFVANIKSNKNNKIVSDALTILENMEHRGACGCESNTGDGAGIQIQVPHEFFFEECLKMGIHLPPFGKYAVGVIFFPKELKLREECRDIFIRSAEKIGLEILAWRKVPVNPSGIGPTALSVEPMMEQDFIACPDYITDPIVTVKLLQSNGNSIFVIGKVNKPGQYPANRRIDVLQALSLAGGLTVFAKESAIHVIRRVGNETKAIPFDYDDVIDGDELEQNIILEPGDTVSVP